MVPLKDIFDIFYGVNLELINCEILQEGVPFVSRTSTNNGVSAYVKAIDGVKPNPKNTLSVACSGSVLATFFHPYEYYSGRDVYILSPKKNLTESELLFYCTALEKNKYKYNYGRQANKTLKDIMVPSIDEIPIEIKNRKIGSPFNKKSVISLKPILNTTKWQSFKYSEIFDIRHGFFNKKPLATAEGEVIFIGATDSNNGITSYHTFEDVESTPKSEGAINADINQKMFQENSITVSNNGSVGYAFYQPRKFTCSHDINPLYLKNKKLTKYIAIFLCTLIELEKFRWAYGRKWRPIRMPSSKIKLPVDKNGNPDWQFMEDYIKSLPYSSNL
jgi:hypothetical protein